MSRLSWYRGIAVVLLVVLVYVLLAATMTTVRSEPRYSSVERDAAALCVLLVMVPSLWVARVASREKDVFGMAYFLVIIGAVWIVITGLILGLLSLRLAQSVDLARTFPVMGKTAVWMGFWIVAVGAGYSLLQGVLLALRRLLWKHRQPGSHKPIDQRPTKSATCEQSKAHPDVSPPAIGEHTNEEAG